MTKTKVPQTSAGTAVPQFTDSDRKPVKLTEVVHPDGRISQYPPSDVWDDWVEWDEPESLGAIGLAAREKLDNLIFVVNCNLQRLDGPVRGNGKIIQELEGEFRGAGWNA